ncbi:MAG: trypsin-like peptidase domain-containing protein [Isosphaeraceae bacterium]
MRGLHVGLGLSLALVATAPDARAQAPDLRLNARMTRSTVKIAGQGSVATGFVVTRPATPADAANAGQDAPASPSYLLVTADHVLAQARGDEVTVFFHKAEPDGWYTKAPARLAIRREGRALWTKHPSADVAVIAVTPPIDAQPPGVPDRLLATEEDLARLDVEAGDVVRCAGFPHPNQFDTGEAGFPVTRMGCIAGAPVRPATKVKSFLIDLNAFEGDSGGAVYLLDPAGSNGGGAGVVLGLVTGQQFIDEEFRMTYQAGKFRHRMGLAIVAPAWAIREAIRKLDETRS